MAPASLEISGEHPQAPADSGVRSASIDDLPPEILGLIFMLVHQDLGKGTLLKGLGALFMTCKHWNQLALSIQEFWSSIETLVDDEEVVSHSHHLTTITTFIERSGSAPLSLTLSLESLRSPTLDHTKMFTKAALRLLLDNFQRWRSVSFNFGQVLFEFPPIPGHVIAPLLEHIDIRFCYMPPPSFQQSHYTALVAAAPGLRSYFTHPCFKVPVNMPWEQLQRFYCFSLIPPEQALYLLQRAKSLQECHFAKLEGHDVPSLESSALPEPRKVTSAIRSMSVAGIRPRVFRTFLSRLDTPNLNMLQISFPDGYVRHRSILAASQYSIIFSFLSSGSCRLSSLTIDNLAMHENKFIDCLRLLSPTLSTLNIRTGVRVHPPVDAPEAITNSVLKSLTYDNSGSIPLCPILESLTLKQCIDADDGVLSDMVQSRHWSSWTVDDGPPSGDVTMLRHLDVVFAPHTHLMDQQRLNGFYQNGLRGVVRFGPP